MDITKGYATIAAGQIHYAAVAGDGIPIIFIHKTVSTFRMWLPVMAQMPAGHAMIAFDTPGFGESFDPDHAVAIGQYADWIGEAIDALGIDHCHLVGHHTGAFIALDLAAKRPDRTTTLTLIGPAPLTDDERREMAATFHKPFMPTTSGGYLLDTWEYIGWAGASADLMLMNREMSAMLRSYQTRAWTYESVWKHDFRDLYVKVATRLLIMCAPDDILFPYFERSRSLRTDAAAVLLSGGANYETDLVPGEIAQALANHIAE